MPHNEMESYADLAFRARRQKIDDDYQRELNNDFAALASRGAGNNSSIREVTELQHKTKKVERLILAQAEALIEAYQSHRQPIDEIEMLKQVDNFTSQTIGGMVSVYKGQIASRSARTGQQDLSAPARAQSFEQELTRRSHAAQTEARLLIKRAKLAETHAPAQTSQVHNEYHLHGVNSRVNVGSTDQSVNTVFVQPDEIFAKIRAELETAIADTSEKAEIFDRLAALEQAQGTPAFTERLGTFLAFAANWTTVIAPFLPALTQMAHKALS